MEAMEVTSNGCSCGCSSMTSLTAAAEACGCGCDCCGESAKSAEAEIVELQNLRAAIDARLSELSEGVAGR